MVWLVLGVVAASVLYWGNTTFHKESYIEFLGRQAGSFVGAFNVAVKKGKEKEKETSEDEAEEDS